MLPVVNQLRVNQLLPWLITIFASALIFIWPLPNTIALRHALLGLGFLFSLSYLWSMRHFFRAISSWNVLFLVLFFGWLLFHLFFLSTDYDFQKNELLSVWMRSFMALAIGLSFGIILEKANVIRSYGSNNSNFRSLGPMVNLIFFIGLNGTVFIFFISYAIHAWRTGRLIYLNFFEISYLAKTPFVISCALLAPLCFLYLDQVLNKNIRRIWLTLITISLALILFSIIFANSKNGFVIFLICLIEFLCYFFYQYFISKSLKLRQITVVCAILGAFSLGAFYHILNNPAWLHMVTEIRYGIDIEGEPYWKDRARFPQPVYESGEKINGSAYERTAWFTAGLNLIPKYPLGFGLLTHSFGRLAKKEWADFNHPINGKTYGSTHSGWMDMILGQGIVGILLLWVPLGVAWRRSFNSSNLVHKYIFWSAPVVFFTYLITEVAGAHFTELLVFLLAFYSGATLSLDYKGN